jgi:hypothetical protein
VLNRTVTHSVFIVNDCSSGTLLYSFRHRRASAFRGTQFEQLMRKRLNEKHCEATSRDWRKRACHVQIRCDQILQLAEQCHAISWLGDQHACASGTELPRWDKWILIPEASPRCVCSLHQLWMKVENRAALSRLPLKLKPSHYTPRNSLGGDDIAPTHPRPRHKMGWVVIVTRRPRIRPGEKTLGTHCKGGWVGPRAGLDIEVRGKVLCLCWGSNLDRPVVQPVARHYTDWATRLTCISRSRARLKHSTTNLWRRRGRGIAPTHYELGH